jgi:hypothetical protein
MAHDYAAVFSAGDPSFDYHTNSGGFPLFTVFGTLQEWAPAPASLPPFVMRYSSRIGRCSNQQSFEFLLD